MLDIFGKLNLWSLEYCYFEMKCNIVEILYNF